MPIIYVRNISFINNCEQIFYEIRILYITCNFSSSIVYFTLIDATVF